MERSMKKKIFLMLIIFCLILIAFLYQNRLTGKAIISSEASITSLRINDLEIDDKVIIDKFTKILSNYEYGNERSSEIYTSDRSDITITFMSDEKPFYLVIGKTNYISGYTNKSYQIKNYDELVTEVKQLFNDIIIENKLK